MITEANRQSFKAELAEMHRLRKVHFVDERKWSQMTIRNGGEFDNCDDNRTIYFLALDHDGHIGVSMRARPTDDKCIIADVFPQLVHPDSAPVKSARTWEISRIFATKAFRTRSGLRRRDEVFLASMEAAVDQGVSRMVGIIDTYLLPQAMRFPWRLAPLGLPAAYPEGEMIGVDISVSHADLTHAREALALSGSIITTAIMPAQHPAHLPYDRASIALKPRTLPVRGSLGGSSDTIVSGCDPIMERHIAAPMNDASATSQPTV